MIKVLIVDDQELIRDSLELLITSDSRFSVVGLAENGSEAIRQALTTYPDVILMDIRMPELNGIECVKHIKQENSRIKIIMLTTFDDDEYIYNALKHGADGFLLKGIAKRDLLASIETVYSGGASLDPKTAQKVFDLFGRIVNTSFTAFKKDPN